MHLVNIFIEWRKNLTRNYIGSLPGRRGFGEGKSRADVEPDSDKLLGDVLSFRNSKVRHASC